MDYVRRRLLVGLLATSCLRRLIVSITRRRRLLALDYLLRLYGLLTASFE